MRMIALSAALAAGLIGGNAVADHGQFTDAALNDFLSSATAYGTGQSGPYVIKYNPDGSANVATDSGFKDSGIWRVDGNVYCAKWKKIRKGKESCWEVFHKGGDDYHFEIKSGNGESLDARILK